MAGIAGLAAGSAFGVQTYLITDLGSLGGGTATAAAINNSNQVTGASSRTAGPSDAYLFSNGTMHDLGNLGAGSSGTALNNLGHVVGSATTVGTTNHPFLFRNGKLMDLGLPIADNFGVANGVNDSDQVVGQFVSGTRRSAVSHAFLWQNGGFRDLGTLGGVGAYATAINDAAQVVGASASAGGVFEGFVWQNGVMTALGVLPGGFSSSATAINANGQIVGSSSSSNASSEAVLFANGTVTPLGIPSGFASSTANAINNNGIVVGTASVGSYRGISHAFIAENGAATDLNRLIPGNSGSWVLEQANGINDDGIIVGTGTTNNVLHAFLLTPTTQVTEPARPIDLTSESGNAVVSLSWTGSVGATSYNVKRSTSSSGPFTTIASTVGTTFTDNSVVDCTVYTYVVSALNSAGESPNSASTGGNPQSVPPVPGTLTATQNTPANLFDGSAIVLSWQNTASSSCAEDVVVERCTDGVSFQEVFTVGLIQNSIVDGFLNSGTRYFYRIRNQSTGGESGPSNIAGTVAP